MPNAEKASFETVARALTILRLTRWLTLARKRRAKDGTKQSNLYILHDEPLTVFEAMRLDDDYLALVCNLMTHSSKAIQHVAASVLNDISNDPYLSGKKLPTRLEILLGRISVQTESNIELSTDITNHESEDGQNSLIRNQSKPVSESEVSSNALKNQTIRNPKPELCSSNNNIKILLQNTLSHISIPKRFYGLRESQQQSILKMMQHLSYQVQQQIFLEWDERCKTQNVRKPAAYLFGIIQKAMRGELNDLVEQEKTKVFKDVNVSITATQPTVQHTYNQTPEERKRIQEYIQNMKQLVSNSRGKF